ncbi:PTS system mannose/fructose/N-acetylgalactosamine-transporter subunit IIB [Microbacterium sp.]|uniref:PTS system mannose/fructose/N-acetylgalactosamine-transporter subunit IIB n=1 Tax=Microbacterium sp. TaxID=51671 RepID=UPI0039E48DC2
MSISFLRVDDRVIHGLITTRWAREVPCDGLVVVDDMIAANPVLKEIYSGATNLPTFVWTTQEWAQKRDRVLESVRRYFVITKEPIGMSELLLADSFEPGIDRVVIGPLNERPGTTKLGKSQYLSEEEVDAVERMHQAGYRIWFALLSDDAEGYWPKFRPLFGLT